MKLRGYQQEVIEKSLRGENDVVVLPTGSGKTLCAIEVIKDHFYKTKGTARVVFLATKRVLVDQQHTVLSSELSDVECVKLIGDLGNTPDMVDSKLSKNATVFVMTPQILVDHLCVREKLAEFSLFILDEVHNARGEEPYSQLLDIVNREKGDGKRVPQLLGLTATLPIGKKPKDTKAAQEFILKFCAKMGLTSAPSSAMRCSGELQQFIANPEESTFMVPARTSSQFLIQLQGQMAGIQNEVCTKGGLSPAPENVASQEFIQWCKQAQEKVKTNRNLDGIGYQQINSGLDLLTICSEGLLLAELVTDKAGADHIKHEMGISRWSNGMISLLSAFQRSEQDSLSLKLLKETLHDVWLERSSDDLRIIVFVQTRQAGKCIAEKIDRFEPQLRVTRTCSSSANAQKHGLTEEENRNNWAEFRSGGKNVMIATSVANEGIDIPECGAAILYLNPRSMIDAIQTKGRVRDRLGRILKIVNSNIERQEERVAIEVKYMRQAIALIHRDRHHLQQELQRLALTLINGLKQERSNLNTVTSNENPEILCSGCKMQITNINNIRLYVDKHMIVLDSVVADGRSKVRVGDLLDVLRREEHDGVFDGDYLECINCHAVVGAVRFIRVKTAKRLMQFPSLNVKKIIFRPQNEQCDKTFQTWKKVKTNYKIECVSYLELLENLELCEISQ